MVEAAAAPVEVPKEKSEAPETMVKTEDKLVIVDAKVQAPFKISKGSLDRDLRVANLVPTGHTVQKKDVALAKLEDEKRVSFIKAWEQGEKTKAENKAQKKAAEVSAWENSKKAALESKLKKHQEDLEKKKAEYGEKIKNKVATVHKQAEEKRAIVEAKRGEEVLKVEEATAKFRATNRAPQRVLHALELKQRTIPVSCIRFL